jgi:hypothetical protein
MCLGAYAKFEFAINYTTGIVRTYNYPIYTYKTAPSFKNIINNEYMWGVLFDFKIYKNTYISVGTEHKAMSVEVSQTYTPSDLVSDKYGDYGINTGSKNGWSLWSLPIRLSYRQPIYKGVYISPNFGFSYLYNTEAGKGLSSLEAFQSVNGTALYMFNVYNKGRTNLNTHLFQIQAGAELGYTHNFFSVYFGTNYSKGLNKMFLLKVESTERDIYSNSPTKTYNVDVTSRGTNINFYLGMRFQLYPIIKIKRKEKN